MVINIHAGHNPDGKVACGAVGFIKESTEARKVKNEVKRQLKKLGHTVYDCTCENGISQSNVLARIVNACNAHKVDLDVSIHFNSGASDKKGNGKTTGTEVWIYKDSKKAQKYAESVCKSISALGFKNRGVKVSTSLYFLKKTKAQAMLIECCFVDDKDDVEAYDYQSMASAIVKGITGQVYIGAADVREDKESGAEGAETKTGDPKTVYRVQVGAYNTKKNALKMQEKLKKAGFDSAIVKE